MAASTKQTNISTYNQIITYYYVKVVIQTVKFRILHNVLFISSQSEFNSCTVFAGEHQLTCKRMLRYGSGETETSKRSNNEPRNEKSGFLTMRKQRRRSASR